MEKKTMSANAIKENVSNYIPDDTVFSILSKLPLKSFKRFQCVRKSWSLLSENNHFMNMFRSDLLSNSHRCSYYDGASLLLTDMDYRHYHSFSGERFQNHVELDCSHLFQKLGFFPRTIVGFGSINGTFCLDNCAGKIVLWNPATHTFRFLPPSSLVESAILDEDILYHRISTIIYGFGYDDLTNDYKIIRHVSISEHHIYNYDYDDEYIILGGLEDKNYLNNFWEIYSLRCNSWRQLDVDMPSDGREGTQVYMDGVCHWFCGVDEKGRLVEPCLVSFYLSNEVFFITPVPSYNDYFVFDPRWINLAVLNGSIALILCDEDETFHISILGEFGMKESWTKLFIIGPLSCPSCPIGVGTKGEIFFRSKDGELVWFDLSTQMMNVAHCDYIAAQLDYIPVFRIRVYKERVLPIGEISN